MIPTILAVLVVLVAVPLNWYVAWILWRASRAELDNPVLRERTLLAVHSAVIISIFAGVFLNNGMEHPLLEPFWTMIVTRGAILSLVVPALSWLWTYRNGHNGT